MPGMNPAEARAMVDRIILMAEEAMAEALNVAVEGVFERSQVEVPKGISDRDIERHGTTLADSGFSPSTDPEYAAVPGKMEAIAGYDHPGAAAQETGHMTYEKDGEQIDWQARNYTTEGTKAHYLSDPFKAALPSIELQVGEAVAAAIGGVPGISSRVTGPLSGEITLG